MTRRFSDPVWVANYVLEVEASGRINKHPNPPVGSEIWAPQLPKTDLGTEI